MRPTLNSHRLRLNLSKKVRIDHKKSPSIRKEEGFFHTQYPTPNTQQPTSSLAYVEVAQVIGKCQHKEPGQGVGTKVLHVIARDVSDDAVILLQ